MIVANQRCAHCGGNLMVGVVEFGDPPEAKCLACGRVYAEVRPVVTQQSRPARRFGKGGRAA